MPKCPRCNVEVDARRMGGHKSGHVRSDRAKYIYDDEKDPKHRHPLVRRTCDECANEYAGKVGSRYCSHSCAQRGSHNSRWRNAGAAYITLHQRVYVARGRAFGCARCGTRAPDGCYEWANLTGDYEDIADYESMCKRCHVAYDGSRRPNGFRTVFTDDLLATAREMAKRMTKKAVAQQLGVSYANLTVYLRYGRYKKAA